MRSLASYDACDHHHRLIPQLRDRFVSGTLQVRPIRNPTSISDSPSPELSSAGAAWYIRRTDMEIGVRSYEHFGGWWPRCAS